MEKLNTAYFVNYRLIGGLCFLTDRLAFRDVLRYSCVSATGYNDSMGISIPTTSQWFTEKT
jgi:hypothetical protein